MLEPHGGRNVCSTRREVRGLEVENQRQLRNGEIRGNLLSLRYLLAFRTEVCAVRVGWVRGAGNGPRGEVVNSVLIHIQSTYEHSLGSHRRDSCMPRLVLPRHALPSVYSIHLRRGVTRRLASTMRLVIVSIRRPSSHLCPVYRQIMLCH